MEKMDEEQLAGGVAFCRLVLNQPELRVDDLCRASTINRLVADFDKRPTLRQCEPNPNNEALTAVRNYELVIQNISAFYRLVLNQIITRKLPNGLIIVRAGRSNAGLNELNTLLNLLINAAVSSETKEVYINYIKSFDHTFQAEIAERITATQDYVAEISVPEVNYGNCKTVETHIESLLGQLAEVSTTRDANQRQLNEALQERDQIAQNSTPVANLNNSPTKQNTYTELAEAKQQVRMLRQEIADKEELAELSTAELELAQQREVELKEETQRVRGQLLKARADQDEIDELRTKAEQLHRAQQETTRLRERLSDFDFFKARVEELQKENSSLYDARAGLETEIAANRIRLSGMGDQAEHNDRLRGQVQELEEQNLELHQSVQRLQEELKRMKLDADQANMDESSDSLAGLKDHSIGSEIDGSHIPENIRLKNEIKRMTTINAAMLEQQSQQRSAVSDLERQLNRIKDENNRLQNQLVMEKTHSLDIEAFAKEQLEGKDMAVILEQLRQKETNETLEIEQKVWEARLQDASEKIDQLEKDSVKVEADSRSQIEALQGEKAEMTKRYHGAKRAQDQEALAREERLREVERKLRETERTNEKLNIECEQRILDKEQHTRTEQRRLQLETEIDQLRRRIDHNQDVLEKRDKEIEKLERHVQNAKKTTRTAETELRHLREIDENSAKIGSDIMKLENEKRQLVAKLKQSKHREEVLEREKENAVKEGYTVKERIKVIEHERDEKDRLIGEMRQSSQNNQNLQRDNELQQSMFEKLKQQLVDEKLKAQNLVADACAAEKRAESLATVRDENRELGRQVQELKSEHAKLSGVAQMQQELTHKENEINKLTEQLRHAKFELNNDEQHLIEVESLKKQVIEIQIQRDQLKDVEEAHQRRIQQDQSVYNDRMDQMASKNDLAIREREIVEQQFVNLRAVHDKLTSDMEMLMNDRESQRNENRCLRREISEGQQFIDKLQKEKRELSKELDIQLRSRTEVDNNQNMNMHEMLDENGRLREANSRLTNSYSKLKTDYTQIVDDLRTLKHKYNNFKVEHAKTETALNQIQIEAVDYDREIRDLSQRYGLLNELKDKITQENDYLQKQNQHLMQENDELNRNSLNTKDNYNQSQRSYEKQISDLRRQKERVEEKMMHYYKEPSPPKKTKGIMAKLKESLRKSDSKPKRKSDYVSHVPVKSDAESENSFQRTHSDWSRASSQSIETRGDRSGTTSNGGDVTRGDNDDDEHLKLDDLDVSKESQTPKSGDCISLQQFLDETNQMTPTSSTRIATSYSHNETLNRTQSDERSVRSASSAEISRRISSGALNRSTPKENHERPPSYVQHVQQSRPQYQSPLSSSVANHGGRGRTDAESSARLSASMNPRMDRLTAHKTPFEKDKFAESLAKLSASQPKKLFSDPRSTPTPQTRENLDSRYL